MPGQDAKGKKLKYIVIAVVITIMFLLFPMLLVLLIIGLGVWWAIRTMRKQKPANANTPKNQTPKNQQNLKQTLLN